MTATTRRRHGGQRNTASTAGLVALAAVIGLAALTYGCWRAGRVIAGIHTPVPRNPVTAAAQIASGALQWPTAATVLLATVVVVAAVVAGMAGAWWARGAVVREFDEAAKYLPTPRELTAVTAPEAKKAAQRLLGEKAVTSLNDYGLKLGTLAGPSKAPIFMHWEWVGLVVGGPRCGKSTGMAIPMICQAPGPVVTTSNKPDLHHTTRWVRSAALPDDPADREKVTAVRRPRRGQSTPVRGRIWVSDLQHIAGDEGQVWWWDPLAGIDSLSGARELAAIFKGAVSDASARVDGYFDGAAQDLLALYIFAAAVGGGDLVHVNAWLGDYELELPATLLKEFGAFEAADRIATTQGLHPRQKDGIYDMARRFVAVMNEPAYARTVVPPRRKHFDGDTTHVEGHVEHNLPQFSPAEFVTSTDTLYALSMEGAASASSLTTALVDGIFKAAIAEARRQGGRLRVPLVAILDEAANVCRLPELPNWYSHFGSQGIVVITILQSLAQAATVWSDKAIDTLTGALNVFYYAGSSYNEKFLGWLCALIGNRDVRRYSRSAGRGGGVSVGESWSSEPILGIDKLASLPQSRAVVQTSGNRPVLVAKNVYWNGPYRHEIAVSKDLCAPYAVTTPAPTARRIAA